MLALALSLAVAAEPSVTCTATDEGRDFPTCFDPWRGLELGLGGGASTSGAVPLVSAGLRFRNERDSRSKVGSTWLVAQRVGTTDVTLVDGRVAVTSSAWAGVFRRHVDEGTLVLPTTPPITLPFPLDVTLAAEALRYERRLADGNGWTLDAVRLGVLFDPVRSASGRFHLALGPSAAYRIRSDGSTLSHEISPLTGAQLLVNFESDDGLWVLRGQGTAGWVFEVPQVQGAFRARGELELSRVVAAVNDQPLALFIRGGGAWASAGSGNRTEWAATAGVAVRLFSAR